MPPPRMPRPPYPNAGPYDNPLSRPFIPRLIGIAVLVFIVVIISSTATYVVEPGTRGIKVTLGKAADQFLPEEIGRASCRERV